MSERSVGDVGEFGLIERLRAELAATGDSRLALGIGDDAAVWRQESPYTIATTDTMVDEVHFLRDRVAARDVGWKALAVNISDIAAMGGVPRFALVTLCLRPETPVAWVDALYEGVRECARAYGVTIAGGDIVASPVLTISVALTGEPTVDSLGTPLLLRRDAARAGDVIAVSGDLGSSAGGMLALGAQLRETEAERALVRRHMHPEPRVGLGQAAARAGVQCAIDVSDGLVQDMRHICDASGCGAILNVDDIPVDPALLAAFPDDALGLAATGGEDYELVLVAPHAAIEALSPHAGVRLTVVGEMVEDAQHAVHVVDAGNNEVRIERGGWDHLRSGPG